MLVSLSIVCTHIYIYIVRIRVYVTANRCVCVCLCVRTINGLKRERRAKRLSLAAVDSQLAGRLRSAEWSRLECVVECCDSESHRTHPPVHNYIGVVSETRTRRCDAVKHDFHAAAAPDFPASICVCAAADVEKPRRRAARSFSIATRDTRCISRRLSCTFTQITQQKDESSHSLDEMSANKPRASVDRNFPGFCVYKCVYAVYGRWFFLVRQERKLDFSNIFCGRS